MIEDYKMGICSQHTFNLSLTIYYCGSKICREESWNPKYTDNFTLFYVFSGEGKVRIGDNEFDVKSGQGFLVPPKVTATYHSLGQPSEIAWVGFYGFIADSYLERAGLTLNSPVYKDDQEQGVGQCFLDIIEFSKLEHNRYCKTTALLYMIMAKLLDIYDAHTFKLTANTLMENYLKKAMQYIDMNYSEKISVSDIANFVGIDRKYLHYIFKKKLDIGPQQYLINFRMSKACIFLEDNDKSVADVAKIVGYDNPLNFSKMFKKTFGLSPKEYKKNPIFIKYKVVSWGGGFNSIN